MYYKVLRDKHDNSLINTLQDLNNIMKSTTEELDPNENKQKLTKNYFVKFEHTKFSDQNIKAMTLLIILLDRKNEIIKNLSVLST